MSATARTEIRVHLPADKLLGFIRDPHAALPVITGFGDFAHHRDDPDSGHQKWNVIYHVGALQLGGRVAIDSDRADGLDWHSVRGTRHTFSITVAADDDPAFSRLALAMDLSLSGLVMARIAERAAAGIMRRHLDAAAEQLRHHAEWCL